MNTRYDFMKLKTCKKLKVAEHNSSHGEITYSETYTEAMHSAHYPAMFLSLFVAVIRNFNCIYFLSMEKS